MAKEVTKRSDNYSQWYDNLVVKADLASAGNFSIGCISTATSGSVWYSNTSSMVNSSAFAVFSMYSRYGSTTEMAGRHFNTSAAAISALLNNGTANEYMK